MKGITAALEGKRDRPGPRLLLLFFTAILTNEQADLECSQLLFKVLEWGWCIQGLDSLLSGLCVDAWSTHAAVPPWEPEQQLQQGVHVFSKMLFSKSSFCHMCVGSFLALWFMLFIFHSCCGDGTSCQCPGKSWQESPSSLGAFLHWCCLEGKGKRCCYCDKHMQSKF